MPNNSQINIGVKYNVDQASVNAVKKSLQDLQNIKVKDFTGTQGQLIQIQQTAKQVERALTNAFNPTLNTVNLEKFKGILAETDRTIDSVFADFSKAGAIGNQAFGQMAHSIMSTNTKLTQTKTLLTSMGQTMMNTVKWGIASSVMNTFTNSVRSAFEYVKALDSSLNDIRIVTKQSTDEMANFAVQANNAAQSLGRSTMDYTKAALTFYQQGLGQEEVQARTEATLKAQNITGAGDQMADYLTAVWNGYKVANEEAELYVDKLAAVADSSASNMSQLAIAMSKVASSANLLGVPVDKLNAQIATITATTRQAPESVGNALKTIYSRINDIATGADDAQISLGNYSSKMAQVGISVLDANGRLRDTGDVIDEIGGKWQTLSHEQQIYLARTMAGQRQYNNLLALFENWGKYSDLVNISMEAQGATAQKNAIYMESLGAKMQQLGAAGQRLKSSLIDEEDLKDLVDFGTKAVNLFGDLVDGLGGGKNAILAFGSVIVSLFSDTIGREIGNTINKARQMKASLDAMKQSAQATKSMQTTSAYQTDPNFKQYVDNMKQMQEVWSVMSKEQIKAQEQRYNAIRQEENRAKALRESADAGQELANVLNQKLFNRDVDLSQRDIGGRLKQSLEEVGMAAQVTEMQLDDLLSVETTDEQYPILLDQVKKDVKELASMSGIEVSPQLFDALKNDAELTIERIDLIRSYINKVKNAKVGAQTFKPLQQSAEQAANSAKRMADQADQANKRAKTIYDAQAVTKFASGLGRVATGVTSVVNLFKTWQDSSVSLGQKLSQTLTSATFLLPSMITGVKDVVKNFGAFKDAISSIIIKLGNLIASKTGDAAASAAQAGAEATSSGAKLAGAAAAQTQTTANLGLAASFATIVAAALPFIAIGVAIAIAAKQMYDAYMADAKAAQKAAQTAKQAKEAYEELRQAYEDLKASLENYNSARDAIVEMTKGTQQWRDAVREVNDSVIDLIQKYPQLADKVKNVNGQLILSKEDQLAALQAMSDQVDTARLASIKASADSRDATLRSQARNSSRSAGIYDNEGNFIQATTDQVMDVVEAYSDNFSTNTEQMVKAIAEETHMSEQMVASIIENTGNLHELSDQLINNTQATKLAYQSIAAEKLQTQEGYQHLDELGKQVANTIAGADLKNIEDRITQEWTERLTGSGISKTSSGSNQIVQQMLTALNKAQNTNWGMASNAVKGTDSNRTFAFLDEQGELVERTAAQVAQTIAASQALLELGNSAEKASEILNSIQNFENQSNTTGLKDFIGNKGFDNLTSTEFEGIQSRSHQMATFFNENYAQFGYTSGLAFQQAFEKAQTAAKQDWKRIGQNSFGPVKDALNDIFDGKEFTLKTSKNIANAFDQAFKQVGKSGIQTLSDFFELDFGDDQEAISELFASADLSTPEGLKELQLNLQAIGDGSFAASEEWKAFKEQVQNTQFENPLDKIFDQTNTVNSITKDIKKYSIISQQDFQTLRNINPEINQLFTRVAQGYQFIGQKGNLMQLLTGGTNGYIQAANEFDKIKNSAKQLGDSFAEDFQSSVHTGIDLTGIIQEKTAAIGDNKQLWAALGTNSDYLEEQVNRYIQLSQKKNDHVQHMSESEKAEYEQLENQLQGFLDKAATAPDLLDGITQSLRQAAALGAESISELNDLFAGGDIDGQMFGEALQKVSDTQMSNLGFDVDQYEDFVKILQSTNEEMAQNEYLARQVAKSNMRISKGMNDLISNFEDWNDALLDFKENGDISSLVDDWGQIRQAMANLFDADEMSIDMLGPQFVANNLDKIQAVKDGVDGAYEELDALMDQELLVKAYGVADFSQLDSEVQQAYNKINQISNDATIEVGAVFSGTDQILNQFNKIAAGANWTSEQAQAAFAQMGYDVQIQGEQPGKQQDTEQTQYYVPPTYKMVPKPFDLGPFGKGTLKVPQLENEGHYESAGSGTKETYKPGFYSIKTVTKNGKGSGGNISRNIAKSNAPKSSKGSGGKGGGGKKAQSVKLQDYSQGKEHVENKNDPYHNINLQLKEQQRQISKIQKQQKKITGQERLKNLRAQTQTLKEQDRLLTEKSGIAKGELDTLGAELSRQGLKVDIDADGFIANYNDLLNKATEKYNDAIDARNEKVRQAEEDYNKYVDYYNTLSAEDQEVQKGRLEAEKKKLEEIKKAADKNLETQKKQYDTNKDNLKTYQNTLQLLKDIEDDQQKIKEQLREIAISASQIRVDLSLDAGDLQRQWLDFEKKVIKKIKDDDLLGQALYDVKTIQSYIDSQQVKQVNREINSLRTELAKMQDGITSGTYGDDKAKAQERLNELLKKQQDQLIDIQQLVNGLMDKYLKQLDKVKDNMDGVIDQYDRVGDLIENNIKLTQLLYGDKAYGTMQKYYQLQKANNANELNALKEQQLYWQKLMVQYANSGNQQAYEKAKENVDNLTDQLNDKLSQMIENLSKQWQNRVNGIIDKLNNALTGGRGLDYLNEEWDYVNQWDDTFLDPVESRMGINEIQDLYQQAIDGLTGSPAQQQKMNKLMSDQLKLLREKDNLTQYDLDRAKAALEVEKARLALEEARDSKTKMRLRRDSQGNYTYQYVADEQKLSDLQKSLADAQANLYNMDKEHYKETLNDLYDTYKDYLQKMQALNKEYQATEDADERARIQARIDLMQQSYGKYYDAVTSDSKFNKEQYLAFSTAMGMGLDPGKYTNEQLNELVNNIVPQAGTEIEKLRDKINGEGGLLAASKNAIADIANATKDYDTNVAQMLASAGTSLNTISQVISENGTALDQNIDKAAKFVSYYEDVVNISKQGLQGLNSYLTAANSMLNGVTTATNLENLKQAYNILQQSQNDMGENVSARLYGSAYQLGLDSIFIDQGNQLTGENANAITTYNAYDKNQRSISLKIDETGENYLSNIEGQLKDINTTLTHDNFNFDAISQDATAQAQMYDESSNNQIAQMVREVASYIGHVDTIEELNQNVNIQASFPNVINHVEIEEAFNQLVNLAAQQAARNGN